MPQQAPSEWKQPQHEGPYRSILLAVSKRVCATRPRAVLRGPESEVRKMPSSGSLSVYAVRLDECVAEGTEAPKPWTSIKTLVSLYKPSRRFRITRPGLFRNHCAVLVVLRLAGGPAERQAHEVTPLKLPWNTQTPRLRTDILRTQPEQGRCQLKTHCFPTISTHWSGPPALTPAFH